MKKQIIYVTYSGIRVVVDRNSDPRNVRLFANYRPKEETNA